MRSSCPCIDERIRAHRCPLASTVTKSLSGQLMQRGVGDAEMSMKIGMIIKWRWRRKSENDK